MPMDSFQEQLNLSPDNCPGTTREPGEHGVSGGVALSRSYILSSGVISSKQH